MRGEKASGPDTPAQSRRRGRRWGRGRSHALAKPKAGRLSRLSGGKASGQHVGGAETSKL